MEEQYPVMVTIECCVYNHEPYLRQCLDGFIMQKTNFPFEAIVHDDASTDGSAAIIMEYAEKYPDIIKPIIEKENQYSKGNGILRKYLDTLLKGKYIAWCEGDDYWIDPLKLQTQYDFMESHQEYVLCHTGFNLASGKRRNHTVRLAKDDRYFPQSIIEGMSIGSATAFYRRDIYQKLPKLYTKNKWPMGDYPMWIEFSHEGKIKFLPSITACYRVLEQSSSHGTIEKEIAFANATIEIKRFYAHYYNISLPNDGLSKDYYLTIMKSACKHNSKEIARDSLKESAINKMISFKQVLFFLATNSIIIKKLLHLVWR